MKENMEREKMYKNEMNMLKKEELKYNLLKQKKIDDYHKDKNIEKLKAKDQRLIEFRFIVKIKLESKKTSLKRKSEWLRITSPKGNMKTKNFMKKL
jgi:hypothetical protein